MCSLASKESCQSRCESTDLQFTLLADLDIFKSIWSLITKCTLINMKAILWDVQYDLLNHNCTLKKKNQKTKNHLLCHFHSMKSTSCLELKHAHRKLCEQCGYYMKISGGFVCTCGPWNATEIRFGLVLSPKEDLEQFSTRVILNFSLM